MAIYDLETGKSKFTDWAKSRYGRGPENDDEWGKVGEGINVGDGIDDDEFSRAQQNADRYAQTLGWKPPAPPPNTAPPSTPSGPPNTPAGDGSVQPATGPVTQPVDPAVNQMRQALIQQVMGVMNRTPGVDPSAPEYRAQLGQMQRTQGRSTERLRNAAAERAGATGTLGAGGFDNELMQIEAGGQANLADFEAGLMREQIARQQQELDRARDVALGMGEADLARQLQARQIDLQRELGVGDLGLRREGLGLQRQLGLSDLDLRNRGLTLQGQLGRGDLGLRLLAALMGNDQFYSQLGLNAAQIQAILNQNAVNSVIGGF